MAKQKRLISFTDKHFEMLTKIMQEDGQESVSYFLGGLITKESKEREEYKHRKPVGRPRGKANEDEEAVDDEVDWSNDLPKDKPYFNQMIGAKELFYLENRKIVMPPRS